VLISLLLNFLILKIFCFASFYLVNSHLYEENKPVDMKQLKNA
jgi:hypothetical protein